MLQGFLCRRRRQGHLRQAAGVTMVEQPEKEIGQGRPAARDAGPYRDQNAPGTAADPHPRLRCECRARKGTRPPSSECVPFPRHRFGDLDRHRGAAGYRAAGPPGRLLRPASADPGGHSQYRPASQVRRHGRLHLCRPQDARFRPRAAWRSSPNRSASSSAAIIVISIQEGREGDLFEPLRERIRNGKGRIRKMGPDYLAYSLLDTIIDHYFIILEKFAERIEIARGRPGQRSQAGNPAADPPA